MNFKAEFIQNCFQFSADFIKPSFHMYCAYLSYSSSSRIELLFYLQCTKITLHILLRCNKFNQLIYFFRDKCKFISRLIKLLKSRNLSSSFLSSPSRHIMAPSTCTSLLNWWNYLNNLTKLHRLYSKDIYISFVRIAGTKKNVWE